MWDTVIKNWPPIFAGLSLAGTVGLMLLGKTYAKRESVEFLQGELASVRQRMDYLEKAVDDLPSHQEISALKLEMSELRGDLKAIRPELRRLDRLSDLLLENELKDKNA